VEVDTVGIAGPGGTAARPAHRRLRTAALILAGAASLWLLRSSLGAVYGDLGGLTGVDVRWLAAIVGCEAVAFVASWELNRLALRTDGWFDVAVAQLAGNAASNVVPAGGPVGAAVQLRVLASAGFEMTRAATALGALTLLGFLGLLTIPVVALPVSAVAGSGGTGLEGALWIGVSLLVVVLAGVTLLVVRDGPLARIADAVESVRRRFDRRNTSTDLAARVLAERDSIGAAVRERPVLVLSATIVRTAADWAALYLALLAAGAHPTPGVVLIAFGAATVAGMIPLTPGGLGFVEAGITGALAAVGIDPVAAALAAALYRVANTWLPSLAGLAALGLFTARRRWASAAPGAAATTGPADAAPSPVAMTPVAMATGATSPSAVALAPVRAPLAARTVTPVLATAPFPSVVSSAR